MQVMAVAFTKCFSAETLWIPANTVIPRRREFIYPLILSSALLGEKIAASSDEDETSTAPSQYGVVCQWNALSLPVFCRP